MTWNRGGVEAACSERFAAMFLTGGREEYEKAVMAGTTRPELLWEK